MSYRLSIEFGYVIEFHTLSGRKKFLFFSTMKYLFDSFRKNIYSNFECKHDIEKKMVRVPEVIHIKKII